jgi:arsenate reductase (thioredoxin)
MSQPFFHVLFLCTHNSARSILGEAILNHLGKGQFQAFSAGSQPSGQVNPLALEELRRMGLSTEGYRSKSWGEFGVPGAPRMDFVFTVCDDAAREACPVWPGHPVTAHWGVQDPAAAAGSEEERRQAFRGAALVLWRRIELLLSLPLDKLDRMARHVLVTDIGRR